MWYGKPQFANEMYSPFSKMTISSSSFNLLKRAAAVAPPATPPMITILRFILYNPHFTKFLSFGYLLIIIPR